jgi:hypothetical protein
MGIKIELLYFNFHTILHPTMLLLVILMLFMLRTHLTCLTLKFKPLSLIIIITLLYRQNWSSL